MEEAPLFSVVLFGTYLPPSYPSLFHLWVKSRACLFEQTGEAGWSQIRRRQKAPASSTATERFIKKGGFHLRKRHKTEENKSAEFI
jgi:hypothetical protein